MLRIVQSQKTALEESALTAFAARLAGVVRRVLPEAVESLSDDALLASVTARVRQAVGFGITDKADARRYVEHSFVCGWPDEGPPADARAVLTREDLDGEAKMDVLEKAMSGGTSGSPSPALETR